MKFLYATMLAITLSTNAYAVRARDSIDRSYYRIANSKEPTHETVNWIGYIEVNGSNSSRHEDHNLTFIRKLDGESFSVEDAPGLDELHGSEKLLVEIQAVKHPSFLFWGGDLEIKNFKVLKAAAAPESEPQSKSAFQTHS